LKSDASKRKLTESIQIVRANLQAETYDEVQALWMIKMSRHKFRSVLRHFRVHIMQHNLAWDGFTELMFLHFNIMLLTTIQVGIVEQITQTS